MAEEHKKSSISLMGNRFLTLSIPIRTRTWEVSRDVCAKKKKESHLHTLENVRGLREAFGEVCPHGRLTWAFTLNALEDSRSNYQEIRDYVVECHYKYGDEITYFPGYFGPMYLSREKAAQDINEALTIISELVGQKYRPQSIIGGFLSADTLRYLAEKENIHAAQGVIWSQYGIDGGDADGSPSYPYYPSKEHLCKPAQGASDFIECVNLDGWTMDFICAKRYGGHGHSRFSRNSRRGVGPIETYGGMGIKTGHKQVMHTQSVHFDRGFELNGFGWVTNIWEAALVGQYSKWFYPKDLMVRSMKKWIGDTLKQWPDTHVITFGEFGNIWRNHYKNNEFNYRFETTGSGIADSKTYVSIRWFMNKSFRLGLIKNLRKGPELVMDFTRYDIKAIEPIDPTPNKPIRNWSLVNRINQKQQRFDDKPIPLNELNDSEKELISSYYPELFLNEE